MTKQTTIVVTGSLRVKFSLTFSTSAKISVDDILKFFLIFPENRIFDIPSKLSPKKTSFTKGQILFSMKNTTKSSPYSMNYNHIQMIFQLQTAKKYFLTCS